MPCLGLTAVLVVRDEAARLPDCLRALQGFAARIVVLDTGSTDGTVELARRAGAWVTSRAWNGDFARARNAALEHVGPGWVLSVDADERAVGDAQALAGSLAAVPPGVDALTVEVRNPYPEAGRDAHVHAPARLFRRGGVRWEGAVHERLRRPDGAPLVTAACPPAALTLVHDGYRDPATVRAKARRNADLARDELARVSAAGPDEVPARARAWYELGRSLLAAEDLAGAVTALHHAVTTAGPDPLALPARDFLVRARLALGDWAGAEADLVPLRAESADPRYPDWLTARVRLGQGRPGEALLLLRSVDCLVDTLGCDLGLGVVAEVRARAAAEAGESTEALACLLLAMVGYGRVVGRGPALLRLWGSRPASALAGLVAGVAGAVGMGGVGGAVGVVGALADELAGCPDPGPALATAVRAAAAEPGSAAPHFALR